MRLIQFNVYFSHHLHISVLSYITYIIHVHTYMFGTGVHLLCRTYVWWFVIWSGRAVRSTCCCKEYISRMDSILVCFAICITLIKAVTSVPVYLKTHA